MLAAFVYVLFNGVRPVGVARGALGARAPLQGGEKIGYQIYRGKL